MNYLDTDIRYCKGIGEKKAQLFNKLGVINVRDLVSYFPRKYEDRSSFKPIALTCDGETVCINALAAEDARLVRIRRGLELVKFRVVDESGSVDITFFNQPYIKNNIHRGDSLNIYGKIIGVGGKRTMTNPVIEREGTVGGVTGRIVPVYRLTTGLSQKLVMSAVRQALDASAADLPEVLPESLRKKYRLAQTGYAYENIHFPASFENLELARRRLVFEELFLLACALGKMKGSHSKQSGIPMREQNIDEFFSSLPFVPTGAQKRAVSDAVRDMQSGTAMNRLVQGDVGSGKTLVAAALVWYAWKNGYASAFMAPTEILANQHFEAFTKLIEEQEISSCHPVLLTGSTTQKEKRRIYGEIASGEANVIIGTHALIQEKVVYENLGLVITDEQHRFGVKQREALTTRGNAPHVLVMSATPIPRTLAIIVYGDLDISIIDELPAMRLPIKNCVVGTSYRPKAYSFIERQVREGRQAYVICPMVEESEGADGENVTDYTARLREIFPSDITIGMLHGKMKPKEKNGIMEQFARGEIQVLVSTTVVEVGVNVPNATVMMVENAERFGLAQLHQLRGRVGRGAYQSYCIFMQGNEEEETSRRLEILNKSNDGFFIAGEDLKLRGPGDLFGIRQSGQLEFRIGDIYQDSDILKAASDAAGGILDLDRELELPQHEKLKERLNAYMKYDLENLGL